MVSQPTRPHWSQIKVEGLFGADETLKDLLQDSLDLMPDRDGSEAKPFLVRSTDDFLRIGTGNWTMGSYYKQVADIDFDGVDFTPVGHVAGSGFTAFTGSYDGNGYKISNATYNAGASMFIGLFASVEDAVLENLGIFDCSFSSSDKVIGSLAGRAIDSDISRIAVDGGSITTTTSSGYSYAGGLVGTITGSAVANVSDCYFRGTISTANASTQHASGLFLAISEADVSLTVNVDNCWTAVSLGGSSTDAKSSALVSVQNAPTRDLTLNVTNCKFNNEKDLSTAVGEFSSGGTYTPTITGTEGLTTANMYKQASYSGWDFIDTWQIIEDASYPYFQYRLAQSPAPAE